MEQTAKYRRSICAVNPKLLRDDEFLQSGKDLDGKQIIVVGAGPSGMEAAIVCAQRGATVTVYEKRNFIGGAIVLGARTPNKEPLQWLADYYNTMLEKLNIAIKLQTEATAEQIVEQNPYAVFVGCGAIPIIPSGISLDGKRVFTVEQVLEQRLQFRQKKVLVVGGGMTGCEVAELYAMMKNEVTLIEMKNTLAAEVDKDNLVLVMQNLTKENATILTGHKLVAVTENAVLVERLPDHQLIELPADKVILSLGGKANDTLYQQLVDRLERVIPIGDTLHPGRVANAIQTGFEKSYILI